VCLAGWFLPSSPLRQNIEFLASLQAIVKAELSFRLLIFLVSQGLPWQNHDEQAIKGKTYYSNDIFDHKIST